jgi:hypothetical protein
MRRNISELKAKIKELKTVQLDVGYRIDELQRQLDTATDKQAERRKRKRKDDPQ